MGDVDITNNPRLRTTLKCLGFVEGKGFDGIVYTNPDNELMEQVWICFSGKVPGYLGYDARERFDLGEFFKWWESVTSKELDEKMAWAS